MTLDKGAWISNGLKFVFAPLAVLGVLYVAEGKILQGIDLMQNRQGCPNHTDLKHDFHGIFSPFATDPTPAQIEAYDKRMTKRKAINPPTPTMR